MSEHLPSKNSESSSEHNSASRRLSPAGTLACFMLIFVASACSKPVPTPNNYDELWQKSEDYIHSEGWEILEYYPTDIEPYTITPRNMVNFPDSRWCTGFVDPLPLVGSEVHSRHFRVKGHPLDSFPTDRVGAHSTSIGFYFVDGELVNGTSFPRTEEDDLAGAAYALDGSISGPLVGDMTCGEFIVDLRERILEAYPNANLDL